MEKRKIDFIILGFLIFLNIFAWIVVCDLSQPKFLEVNFFDVGQGDAAFIETPESHQILIDGGPSSVILEKLGQEMPFWDRTIDIIVLSHPESDHLSGLIDVLKRYKVENILWTGILRDTAEYKEWIDLIQREGARIEITEADKKVRLSDKIYFDILYPLENLEGRNFKESNNTSVVAKLVFEESSFLFTGDIEESAEEDLAVNKDIKSDILKVAHHGSKTSSSEEFLEREFYRNFP